MPLRILLHIGDAKCGSSSIQASLFQARDALLSQGVLYHPASKTNGHFSFITLLDGKTRGNNAEQEAMAQRNLAEMREMIAQHRPEHLLISGESLFNTAPEVMVDLLAQATGAPVPVHVIAFLRHPVDFYLSGVQQSLKASHGFTPPRAFIRASPATFRRWAAFPGCSGITARLFDRNRLTGGSVVSEFSTILHELVGAHLPDLPDCNENTSLSAEQMIVMQQYRQDFLAARDGQFAPQSNWLLRFFEELNQEAGMVGTRPVLKDAVRACIAAQNLRFIEEFDNRFPALRMRESRNIPAVAWENEAAGWTKDVGSILQDHDPALVQRLKALLPDYAPELEAPGGVGQMALRLLKLGKGNAVRGPYLRYLGWSGREALAAQLRGEQGARAC